MTTPYASDIDAGAFGEHRARGAEPAFRGRIGSAVHPAQAGRYHLYAAWHCPRSHRAMIVRDVLGLDDAVGVSFVHGLRDARGWAFRASTGGDPVNGFSLLREAYEASAPGYRGVVRLPVLWDRATHRIVSDDADTVDVDLATAFGSTRADLYAPQLQAEVDAFSAGTVAGLSRLISRAAYDDTARWQLRSALHDLERRLARSRHVLGSELTLADVRLWVHLVRYDAGPNAHGAVGPALPWFPTIWRYATRLFQLPGFATTTRFEAFTAPFATLPPWPSPEHRLERA